MKRKELTANIVELYQKGWNRPEIGRKFGIMPQTIMTHLKKAGVECRSVAKYKEIDKARLESMYCDKVPMEQIRAVFSVSLETLYRALNFHGIAKRKPINSLNSETDRLIALKMANEYRSGMTLVEIGAQYDFSPVTVKFRMRKFAGSDLQRLKPYKKINREKLAQLYAEKYLAINKIAAELGFSIVTIYKSLEFYHIPKRAGRCGKRISRLRELQIGETIVIHCAVKYPVGNLHTISRRIGIKIRVRSRGDGYYNVTRIS